MGMIKRLLVLLVCVSAMITGCNDDIDYVSESYQSKVTVDGFIECGGYPTVILTRSAGFFAPIDSVAIRGLVATRAKVTVSDGETEEVLTLKKHTGYFPPYIYQGVQIRGAAGRTYHLKVELEGRVYEASTTITPPVTLDSLWFEKLEYCDTIGVIKGRFTDNPDTEDYYRVFTRRVGRDAQYIPVYLSATGDKYFNGKSFTFSLLRGPESISDINENVYFDKGDTVLVKVCTIDRPHFDFWRTIERELYTVGNPFASAGNEVISNVSGGALGVWGGYNPTVYRIVAE